MARIKLSGVEIKFKRTKNHNMVSIDRIENTKAMMVVDTGTERTNLISTNFIYTKRIKTTLYDIPIRIRIVIKDSRSLLAVYATLPVQLGDALSINTRLDIAHVGEREDIKLGMAFLHDIKTIMDC
jgi:hypothetical protein